MYEAPNRTARSKIKACRAVCKQKTEQSMTKADTILKKFLKKQNIWKSALVSIFRQRNI